MLACSMGHDNPRVDAAPPSPTGDAPSSAGPDAAAEPVVVDRARVRTADTDADQLDTGSFSISAASPMTTFVKVTSGPFVLTDFITKTSDRSWLLDLYVSSNAECTGAGEFRQAIDPNESFHGAKLFVKADRFLCVSLFSGDVASGGVTWAGYHPYAAP